MPGLVPGIHVFSCRKTWMAGTSPAMTKQKCRPTTFTEWTNTNARLTASVTEV
jgi:hypothetical protein